MKTAESLPKDQKALWEKKKLLVKSYFSFSYKVCKRLVLQTRKNKGFFRERVKNDVRRGKHLHSTNDVWFKQRNFVCVCVCVCVCGKKTLWENERILISIFLLFPHCFLNTMKNKSNVLNEISSLV